MDGDIDLIDLGADDLPGSSNQGKKIETEHTENFSKSPLRNKVKTSFWPRSPCKNGNRDSAFLSKVKLFLCAFLIVYFWEQVKPFVKYLMIVMKNNKFFCWKA